MLTIAIILALILIIYGSAFWWARNKYLKQIGSIRQKPKLSIEAEEALHKKYREQIEYP